MKDDQEVTGWRLLAKARTQVAAVTAEFQRGLSSVKDPAQRKSLADAYAEIIQRDVWKARASRVRSTDVQPAIADGKPKRSRKAVAAAIASAAALIGVVIVMRVINAPAEDESVITAPPEPAVPAETPADPAAESVVGSKPPEAGGL